MERQSEATSALAAVRSAYQAADYEACLYQISRVLAWAQDDGLALAEAYYYKGNIEEVRGREGQALRSWALGMALLEQKNRHVNPLHGLLSAAVEGLLATPRIFLSFASSEGSLAADLRDRLELRRIHCIDFRRDFLAGDDINDSIAEGLDRSTGVFVLWSATYRTRPYCVAELENARAQIQDWNRIGRAPRLVLLLVDSSSLPESLQDIAWLDVREGLNDGIEEAIVAAARHSVWKK